MSRSSATLATAYSARNNNLNFLRFFFAALVIASHSYPICLGLEQGAKREPLAAWTGRAGGMGVLAVDGFFAISGFLLSASWLRDGDLIPFATRRFLRIYPAFFVCILACIFFVGPLAVPNVGSYFGDPHTYRLMKHLYFGRLWNSLPGAFASNPLPEVINGSLWTIKYEIYCYILLIALGLLKLLRPGILLVLFIISLAVFNGLTALRLDLPFALTPDCMPRLITFFLGGSAIYLCSPIVPMKPSLFVASMSILVLTARLLIWETVLLPTLGVYCLFYLATLHVEPLNAFGRKNDFSYGVYLYAWPIQQLLLYRGIGRASPWILTAASIPVVILIAAASWFLIERPALSIKPRARVKRDAILHQAAGEILTPTVSVST